MHRYSRPQLSPFGSLLVTPSSSLAMLYPGKVISPMHSRLSNGRCFPLPGHASATSPYSFSGQGGGLTSSPLAREVGWSRAGREGSGGGRIVFFVFPPPLLYFSSSAFPFSVSPHLLLLRPHAWLDFNSFCPFVCHCNSSSTINSSSSGSI